MWDAEAWRWAAWLDRTSIDTCSSLFMSSHSLCLVQWRVIAGERENGGRGDRKREGVTKISGSGDIGSGRRGGQRMQRNGRQSKRGKGEGQVLLFLRLEKCLEGEAERREEEGDRRGIKREGCEQGWGVTVQHLGDKATPCVHVDQSR